MGRELKRVSADFNWPLGKPWAGFINSFYNHNHICPLCKGSGLNAETEKIYNSWYLYGSKGGEGWKCHLTQEEVDAIVDDDCYDLRELTHEFDPECINKRGSKGDWVKKNPPVRPTAEEVNRISAKNRPLFLIGTAQWICTQIRAKEKGVFGMCERCDGAGNYWDHPSYEYLADKFEQINPPEGEAYQIWETVSEGSPVSPTCKYPEDLAKWMVNNDTSITEGTTFEQWMNFILGDGWAPSLAGTVGGEIKSGVEFVADNS